MHGLLRVGRRPCDVAIVELRHRREILQRPYLLRQLLTRPDHLVARPHVIDLCPLCALGIEQPLDAIERDAPIVADDPTTAVGVRKAGNDAGPAALHDFRRVGVEHAVVVGLAVFRERFMHLRVGRETGRLQARLDHAQAAIGEYGPLERLVGLQADDRLIVLVDVSRLVRQ